MMSNGRTKARFQIYSNVLFIMEKIWEHSSVEEAKAAGYEVIFHRAQDAAELTFRVPKICAIQFEMCRMYELWRFRKKGAS